MKSNGTLIDIEKEIGKLKAELDDRKAALPMHDATPQQWMAIEDRRRNLEEKERT